MSKKKKKKFQSTSIALISLVLSIIALALSGYFSLQTLKLQVESNEIQKEFNEFERNAKIANIVTKYNNIRQTPIDFKTLNEKQKTEKVTIRSREILLTLNNLFLVSRGTNNWDQYILKASEWPLGSLKRRKKRVACKVWSNEFKDFILNNKLKPVDACLICNDSNCKGDD